jgi:hypothetical protein
MRCRDIYLRIEKLGAYSPVAPDEGEHGRYKRDCMRDSEAETMIRKPTTGLTTPSCVQLGSWFPHGSMQICSKVGLDWAAHRASASTPMQGHCAVVILTTTHNLDSSTRSAPRGRASTVRIA